MVKSCRKKIEVKRRSEQEVKWKKIWRWAWDLLQKFHLQALFGWSTITASRQISWIKYISYSWSLFVTKKLEVGNIRYRKCSVNLLWCGFNKYQYFQWWNLFMETILGRIRRFIPYHSWNFGINVAKGFCK